MAGVEELTCAHAKHEAASAISMRPEVRRSAIRLGARRSERFEDFAWCPRQVSGSERLHGKQIKCN